MRTNYIDINKSKINNRLFKYFLLIYCCGLMSIEELFKYDFSFYLNFN